MSAHVQSSLKFSGSMYLKIVEEKVKGGMVRFDLKARKYIKRVEIGPGRWCFAGVTQ